jgi:hypothetical protein
VGFRPGSASPAAAAVNTSGGGNNGHDATAEEEAEDGLGEVGANGHAPHSAPPNRTAVFRKFSAFEAAPSRKLSSAMPPAPGRKLSHADGAKAFEAGWHRSAGEASSIFLLRHTIENQGSGRGRG